jgi:hypothetical protein
MRIFGLALAGALTLTTLMAAHADQPGPKMRPAGPALGIARGAGSGPAWPAVTGGSGWQPNPRDSGQWDGNWARSHWAPNHYYGLWGPPGAWGGPYTVWGGPYVPYRSYGDWGALEYPYAEWRGPTGGWGNP